MPDRLPPTDLERLCRALGFEKSYEFAAPFGQKDWPPIDTDDTWAVKAMEAADDQGQWPMRAAVSKLSVMKGGKWSATGSDGTVFAKTFPMAVCGALLAALKAGELGS